MLATIGSLLFACDVMLCAACSTAAILYRPHLRKSLQDNGAGKVAIITSMLLVHVVFLTGLELHFVVMKMINSWLAGVIGIFITGFASKSLLTAFRPKHHHIAAWQLRCRELRADFGAVAVSILVWVVQLRTSEKGISLEGEE